MEEASITLEGLTIPIKIIYKNNKNIYFRFDSKNNLIVTAHPRFKTKKVLKLIEENKKSILKMYEKNKHRQDEPGTIRLLGLKYDVKIDKHYSRIFIDNGIIYAESIEKLNKYIAELTNQIFKEEIKKILKIMPNIPEFTLRIRKMKTRWGVCNYIKKTVTLNSELIKYERSIIDYVIVHEFSHFTHHDHSAAFWELVGTYYPDYKKARKELRG